MKENKKRGKFKIISNIYMKRTLKRQKYPHHPPENIIFDFFPHFFFFIYNFWRIMTMTIQDLINFTGQNDKIF